MEIGRKSVLAIGLTIFLTIIYYYINSFTEIYISKYLCSKYICFEMPSYADFLAIWVALLGLFFVVQSLEAWKQQDKYFTAKNNIKRLHLILENLEEFNVGLLNLTDRNKGKLIIYLDKNNKNNKNKKTKLYRDYETYISEVGIYKIVKDLDYSINQHEMSLYQKSFEKVVKNIFNYVNNIDSKIKNKNSKLFEEYEIKKSKISEIKFTKIDSSKNYIPKAIFNLLEKPKTPTLTQQDIELIVIQEFSLYKEIQTQVKDLQDRINRFIE